MSTHGQRMHDALRRYGNNGNEQESFFCPPLPFVAGGVDGVASDMCLSSSSGKDGSDGAHESQAGASTTSLFDTLNSGDIVHMQQEN